MLQKALRRNRQILHEKDDYPHVVDIYLKDSNAFMNTYFARYFEWQGVCRERWFHECIHNNLMGPAGHS